MYTCRCVLWSCMFGLYVVLVVDVVVPAAVVSVARAVVVGSASDCC